MSEYQIGKDFKDLEYRLTEVEEAIKTIATRSAPCSQSEEVVEFSKDLITTDSAAVNFPNAEEVGRCTWDANRSVIFFSNGRVVFTCTVDCNEGSLFTCTFNTKVYALLDSKDGSRMEVLNFRNEYGGVTRDASISREVVSGAIRDSFSRIWGAGMSYECTCWNC
jgi:hypothetical protein